MQACEETLAQCSKAEGRLSAVIREGEGTLRTLGAEAVPLVEAARGCLQECGAWQERHAAILSVLLTNPPSEVTAAAAWWDPRAAEVALGKWIWGESGFLHTSHTFS
jgi:hypothetical protein